MSGPDWETCERVHARYLSRRDWSIVDDIAAAIRAGYGAKVRDYHGTLWVALVDPRGTSNAPGVPIVSGPNEPVTAEEAQAVRGMVGACAT